MKKQITALRSFWNEITFPNQKQVLTNLTNVFLASTIIGAFVCAADFVSVTAVEILINVF